MTGEVKKGGSIKLSVDKNGRISIENNKGANLTFESDIDLNISVEASNSLLELTSGNGNDRITTEDGDDYIKNTGNVGIISSGNGNDKIDNTGNARQVINENAVTVKNGIYYMDGQPLNGKYDGKYYRDGKEIK